MATVIQWVASLPKAYDDLLAGGDERVADWPLMQSPVPTVLVVSLYLLFVKRWGPVMMKNRPAFELRRPIQIYNLFLVIGSFYISWNVGWNGWFTYYNWGCQAVDKSDRPEAMEMARLTYIFYLSKLIELLDTVFFVIRKKDNQVTPLHLIHHTALPIIMWWACKFVPGGHGSITGLLNSGVHVVMYSYYFLAAFGPAMEPYLWWKRYITRLQIAQFAFYWVHSVQMLFRHNCGYPKTFAWVIIVPSTLFLFLFASFYRRSYSKPRSAKPNPSSHEVKSKGA